MFFDKDKEEEKFETQSNIYGMSENDDGMSVATAQHRNGYGIDEPFSRNVNKPERMGTGMSNVTRMTRTTQKTAVTKVNMQ